MRAKKKRSNSGSFIWFNLIEIAEVGDLLDLRLRESEFAGRFLGF